MIKKGQENETPTSLLPMMCKTFQKRLDKLNGYKYFCEKNVLGCNEMDPGQKTTVVMAIIVALTS